MDRNRALERQVQVGDGRRQLLALEPVLEQAEEGARLPRRAARPERDCDLLAVREAARRASTPRRRDPWRRGPPRRGRRGVSRRRGAARASSVGSSRSSSSAKRVGGTIRAIGSSRVPTRQSISWRKSSPKRAATPGRGSRSRSPTSRMPSASQATAISQGGSIRWMGQVEERRAADRRAGPPGPRSSPRARAPARRAGSRRARSGSRGPGSEAAPGSSRRARPRRRSARGSGRSRGRSRAGSSRQTSGVNCEQRTASRSSSARSAFGLVRRGPRARRRSRARPRPGGLRGRRPGRGSARDGHDDLPGAFTRCECERTALASGSICTRRSIGKPGRRTLIQRITGPLQKDGRIGRRRAAAAQDRHAHATAAGIGGRLRLGEDPDGRGRSPARERGGPEEECDAPALARGELEAAELAVVQLAEVGDQGRAGARAERLVDGPEMVLVVERADDEPALEVGPGLHQRRRIGRARRMDPGEEALSAVRPFAIAGRSASSAPLPEAAVKISFSAPTCSPPSRASSRASNPVGRRSGRPERAASPRCARRRRGLPVGSLDPALAARRSPGGAARSPPRRRACDRRSSATSSRIQAQDADHAAFHGDLRPARVDHDRLGAPGWPARGRLLATPPLFAIRQRFTVTSSSMRTTAISPSLTVAGLVHRHEIAGEDPGLDHRVAADAQQEVRARPEERRGRPRRSARRSPRRGSAGRRRPGRRAAASSAAASRLDAGVSASPHSIRRPREAPGVRVTTPFFASSRRCSPAAFGERNRSPLAISACVGGNPCFSMNALMKERTRCCWDVREVILVG